MGCKKQTRAYFCRSHMGRTERPRNPGPDSLRDDITQSSPPRTVSEGLTCRPLPGRSLAMAAGVATAE